MSWVAAAVGVVGAASSYHNGKKQRDAAKKAAQAQQPLIDAGVANAKTLSPFIGDFYGRAKEAYDPAFAHYRTIANGNRAEIIGADPGAYQDIATKYGTLIQSTGELGGARGTGRSAAFNAELPFAAGDDVQRQIAGERASAYPALSAMAGQAANIGGGAAGYGTQAGEGAGGLIGQAYVRGRTAAGDQASSDQDVAKQLFDAYNTYRSGNGKSSSGGTMGTAAASGTPIVR